MSAPSVAWVGPTAHVIPWRGPALLIGGVVAVAAVTSVSAGGPPDLILAASVAALAAIAPLALDDPAHHLLAPVPTTRRRRTAHRLLLSLPVLVTGYLLVALVLPGATGPGTDVPRLAALTALGLATGVVVGRWRPELLATAGATVPLAVVATHWAVDEGPSRWTPLDLWVDQPWAVATVAALVVLVSLGDRRPGGSRPAPAPAAARPGANPPRVGTGR